MLERQVYVLRVWRDAHGELHASLKPGSDAPVTHFGNLELIVAYLKDQFASTPPESETERR